MKQNIVLVLVLLALVVPMSVQAHTENCVSISTRHYYAREVHNDYIEHDIELCMSGTRKSVQYELPPLTSPLTLATTDSYRLYVSIFEVESGDEVLSFTGREVTFELPEPGTRYSMRVEVSNWSDGIIVGSIAGHEVGKILLLDQHDNDSNTLTMSLGGLSGEWWFEVSHQQEDSFVELAVISVPNSDGEFSIRGSSWRVIPNTDEHSPLVVTDDEWRTGGYFAIQATFSQ